MLTTTLALLTAALGASAHYTLPRVGSGSDWQHVRQADNWQNNGFVGDVNSQQIRCFQSSPSGAPEVYSVQAGSTVTYHANPNIYHPGPMQFYLARVPDGQDVKSWTGDGAVWFKVYEEQPNFGAQLTWPSNGALITYFSCVFSLPYANVSPAYRQELVRGSHPQLHPGGQLPSPR